MERPVLNPLFMQDAPALPVRPSIWRRLGRGLIFIIRLFITDLRHRHGEVEIPTSMALGDLVRGLFYRLLFAPLLLFLVIAALVYSGTHPPQLISAADPLTVGLYYDPVTFTSTDGTRLEGWVVPVVDARVIVEQQDELLRKKHPAVVLVHDLYGGRAQMLPLIRPLHDAGYVVLAISLRGSAGQWAGMTFGINEAGDVEAAVDMLSRRPGIDASRIAVLGVGTGANAAVLAAQHNRNIRALVLDRPIRDPHALIEDHLAMPQPWLQWLAPMFRLTFELLYQVDAGDLDLRRGNTIMQARPTLVFDAQCATSTSFQARGQACLQDFLGKHLGDREEASAR